MSEKRLLDVARLSAQPLASEARSVRRSFYMPGHTRYVPMANPPMHSYITVAPGDILAGPHFQVVYTKS